MHFNLSRTALQGYERRMQHQHLAAQPEFMARIGLNNLYQRH